MTFINIIIELLYNLLQPVFAVIIARLLLAQMDRHGEIDFKAWLENSNDFEKSVYFSARFIGVCLLIGLSLS